MKNIIITLSLLSAMAVSAVAQEEERQARPERPDPATVAKDMLSEFDADKNGSLNKEELDKGLTSMRENRPQMQRPQQGQRGQMQRPQQGQQSQRGQMQRPQQGQQGQRGQVQRPQQGQRPQGERPQGQNMTDMFLNRGDTDKNGELSASELTAAFEQMGRSRGAGGPQGRQRGEQGRSAPKADK